MTQGQEQGVGRLRKGWEMLWKERGPSLFPTLSISCYTCSFDSLSPARLEDVKELELPFSLVPTPEAPSRVPQNLAGEG